MNDLDRYAVSLENMEVLRAQVEAQAREIERLGKYKRFESAYHEAERELAALKAQPSGVVPDWLTSSRAFADRLYAAGWRDHADAQHDGVAGMYDELIARLNQPASAGDENPEEGLDEWAKGKFGIGGRYTGKLYGNTDWALARVVWSAALARAALSANHSEQVQAPRVATPEMKAAIWAELDRQGFDSDLVETQSLYFAGIAAAPSAGSQKEQGE